MNNKIKITSIEVETEGGKKVNFSIEEAKEIYKQFHELFGNSVSTPYPIIIERNYWPWSYPTDPVWYCTGSSSKVQFKDSVTGISVGYNCNEVLIGN